MRKHGIPPKTFIASLKADGYPLTADNYYKLRHISYKLAKKYRLLNLLDDVQQVVWVTATKKEKNFDSSKSAFSTYIYVIAERVVINTFIRPLSTFTVGKKIQEFSKKQRKETGDAPTVSEIAQEFGISEHMVQATYLYSCPKNDYDLLQEQFSVMQEDDTLSYMVELEELFTKGFVGLSDLQRAIIDELIIQENSLEIAAEKLGIDKNTLETEYNVALSLLKEYI